MPDSSPNPGDKPQPGGMKSIVQAERLTQIALVLPVSVVVGWFLGSLLDRWLHQTWIYIVGIIVGIVAGMIEAVRMALGAGKGGK